MTPPPETITLRIVLLCVLAKWLGTSMGIYTLLYSESAPIVGITTLGIAPIWLEVVASKFTGVEPARETRRIWRLIDFASDLVSFVVAPPLAMALMSNLHLHLLLGLSIFFFCGALRLVRFLRLSPSENSFRGLPVTYTGYIWWMIYLIHHDWPLSTLFILALISFLMIFEKIRIRVPE